LCSNGIHYRRILSAKQVFLLSVSLFLLLRLDALVGSTPTEYVAKEEVDEMLCERRTVTNSNEKRSVLVCTFVVNENPNSESTNTYRSCVSLENEDEADDCVTAQVSIAKESRSKTKPQSAATEISNNEKVATENEQSQTIGDASATLGRPKNEASSRPIIMGEASYRPPYREQYGLSVGDALLHFHDNDLRAGKLEDNEPSVKLVSWCLDLGHAHMEDAEIGMVFEDGDRTISSQDDHPKIYHVELALQAYNWASKTLFAMTKETEFLDIDPTVEDDKEKMIQLQYYAVVEYAKGEALTIAGEDNIASSSFNEFYSSALDSYRKAQASFENLRYIYAKLSKTDNDKDYFHEERYYFIEKVYANSCFQLAVSLYSKLIFEQNEKINRANEKIIELTKTGLGVEGEELDIVTALMDQANGGMGGGKLGGSSNGAFTGIESLGDLNNILDGNWMDDEFGFGDSEDEKFALEEITGLLDTAILTYQQHANPQPSNNDGKETKPMMVIVNGVPRKSLEEYQEDERLFPWQSSLAMAYEKAATVATMRNQHIRSRELMNLALEVYLDAIIPYYREQETRERKLERNGEILLDSRSSSSTPSISTMSREYAEVSAGHLYVTMADTTLKLGSYEDAKDAYSKAMEWHRQYQLTPEPDGIFNTLLGDEVSLRQYEDFVSTFRQELDQYLKSVKIGYLYRDDSYEAGMLLSIAPLYMAMGKAEPAIRFYKDAISAYERFTKDTRTNKSNKVAVLGLADARFGLATAYFHVRRFEESKVEHALSCDIYQEMFGEGTPPQTESEAALEEMKDMIVESYGEEYYEKLKSYYSDSGDAGNGVGKGSEGSNKPTVVTNFDAFGHNNETMWEDEDDDENDDEVADGSAKETWSNDEL